LNLTYTIAGIVILLIGLTAALWGYSDFPSTMNT